MKLFKKIKYGKKLIFSMLLLAGSICLCINVVINTVSNENLYIHINENEFFELIVVYKNGVEERRIENLVGISKLKAFLNKQ